MATQVLDKALEQRLETMQPAERVAVEITPDKRRVSDVIDYLGQLGVSTRTEQVFHDAQEPHISGVELSAAQVRALCKRPYVECIQLYNSA